MRKLSLKRETLRLLRSPDLQVARGGLITDSLPPETQGCTGDCGGGGTLDQYGGCASVDTCAYICNTIQSCYNGCGG